MYGVLGDMDGREEKRRKIFWYNLDTTINGRAEYEIFARKYTIGYNKVQNINTIIFEKI